MFGPWTEPKESLEMVVLEEEVDMTWFDDIIDQNKASTYDSFE